MAYLCGWLFSYCSDMMANMATRKMNPNRRLLRLMKKHKLTQKRVVELCRCGRSTVHYWTRDPSDPTFMPMKSSYLRLLELELSEARPIGAG